jgi:hypothetical protein
MPAFADRVKESTATTGTGTLTLDGAATGFQSFTTAFGNGVSVYYVIAGGSEWEIGIGTTGAGTLSRDTVLQSSNADALVSFSAGTKDVFCAYVADRAVTTVDAATLTNKTISGASNTLSNIGNAALTNSSVTVNGTAISLGSSGTVTAAAGTLTGTTLASNVVSSSLTSLGTIATGVWQGTAISDTYLATISTAGKVSNSATTATSANTASAIVARDASGNFTAGTITATLSGAAPAGSLSGSTLASGVTASSLTSVGTLTSLAVTGDLTVDTSTLKVDSTNNRVGIATASPSHPLHVVGTSYLQQVIERATVSATAATGTINYDALTQAVLFYTSNASANWTLNLRGSSTVSMNTLLAVGDSLTVTFLVQQGTTAYYPTAHQIDGSSVTPKWQGGTAPTAGNASSIDIYTYTIIKTAATPTYTLLASQTKFA